MIGICLSFDEEAVVDEGLAGMVRRPWLVSTSDAASLTSSAIASVSAASSPAAFSWRGEGRASDLQGEQRQDRHDVEAPADGLQDGGLEVELEHGLEQHIEPVGGARCWPAGRRTGPRHGS